MKNPDYPIVERLGGRHAVVAASLSTPYPITIVQVVNWKANRQISGYGFRALMALAELCKVKYSLADFLLPGAQEDGEEAA